jgi:DNA-binding MarR family transcriptional regulator
LNKSTLTRDLKTTLSAGWVQEVREHANGRTKPLALTTSGKKLVLNAQQAWLTAQIQAAALLGTDTMNALMSITDCINP